LECKGTDFSEIIKKPTIKKLPMEYLYTAHLSPDWDKRKLAMRYKLKKIRTFASVLAAFFPYRLLICAVALLHLTSVSARNEADTLKSYRLQEVEIRGEKVSVFRTTSPAQTLTAKDFILTGAQSVSDVVRQFAGVQVKDYGGIGGLKTVSLRSLGAAHTGISYDGVPVTDYQTGQIDIGRFSIDNIERITLNIGESDNIFQTAQNQSLAGGLNIVTQKFFPVKDKKNMLKAAIKTGSFGLFNPSLLYGQNLSKTFSTVVSADYLQSAGNYPFFQKITNENLRRQNSAVKNLKTEANIYGNFRQGGELSVKVFGFMTDRGLPGPAIIHKDYSRDKIADHTFFTTASFSKPLSSSTDFQANAKFNFSHSDYHSQPMEEVRTYLYFQREYYADAIIRQRFTKQFSASWANDLIYGNINGNTMDGTQERKTWLSAVSGKYENECLDVTAKILYTYSNLKSRFSPYFGLSFKPFNTNSLRLRAFFKNSFRLPTLTDLYYLDYKSDKPRYLKPENARQLNFGLTYLKNFSPALPYFFFSADIYQNKISDKIIAYPTSNMNIWTMYNLGKVDIRGIDLKSEMQFFSGQPFSGKTVFSYTFQQAQDKTNPIDKDFYNKQLPYTPRHSVSVWATVSMPWFEIGYTILYCGKRYADKYNLPSKLMQPFAEQTVTLSRRFNFQKYRFDISAECINIADVQYEIVRSYPMQGRYFILAVRTEFQ
jgi:outer membrane cobalamin receptor